MNWYEKSQLSRSPSHHFFEPLGFEMNDEKHLYYMILKKERPNLLRHYLFLDHKIKEVSSSNPLDSTLDELYSNMENVQEEIEHFLDERLLGEDSDFEPDETSMNSEGIGSGYHYAEEIAPAYERYLVEEKKDPHSLASFVYESLLNNVLANSRIDWDKIPSRDSVDDNELIDFAKHIWESRAKKC